MTTASPMWTIRVKQLNSESASPVQLSSTSSVPDLKSSIHEKLGVAVDRQRLIFRGRVLKNDESLASCSLEDGVTIHLVERSQDAPPLPPGAVQDSSNGQRDNSRSSSQSSARNGTATRPNVTRRNALNSMYSAMSHFSAAGAGPIPRIAIMGLEVGPGLHDVVSNLFNPQLDGFGDSLFSAERPVDQSRSNSESNSPPPISPLRFGGQGSSSRSSVNLPAFQNTREQERDIRILRHRALRLHHMAHQMQSEVARVGNFSIDGERLIGRAVLNELLTETRRALHPLLTSRTSTDGIQRGQLLLQVTAGISQLTKLQDQLLQPPRLGQRISASSASPAASAAFATPATPAQPTMQAAGSQSSNPPQLPSRMSIPLPLPYDFPSISSVLRRPISEGNRISSSRTRDIDSDNSGNTNNSASISTATSQTSRRRSLSLSSSTVRQASASSRRTRTSARNTVFSDDNSNINNSRNADPGDGNSEEGSSTSSSSHFFPRFGEAGIPPGFSLVGSPQILTNFFLSMADVDTPSFPLRSRQTSTTSSSTTRTQRESVPPTPDLASRIASRRSASRSSSSQRTSATVPSSGAVARGKKRERVSSEEDSAVPTAQSSSSTSELCPGAGESVNSQSRGELTANGAGSTAQPVTNSNSSINSSSSSSNSNSRVAPGSDANLSTSETNRDNIANRGKVDDVSQVSSGDSTTTRERKRRTLKHRPST